MDDDSFYIHDDTDWLVATITAGNDRCCVSNCCDSGDIPRSELTKLREWLQAKGF